MEHIAEINPPATPGGKSSVDFSQFGWLNVILSAAKGNLAHKQSIRGTGLLELLEWDSYDRWSSYSKYLASKKQRQ